MKKFFLAGIIAISMVGSNFAYADILPPPGSNFTYGPLDNVEARYKVSGFTDVKDNSTYYDALVNLKARGIVSGYPDGSFRPDNLITRAEFTKIIVGAVRTTPEDGSCMKAYTTGGIDGSFSNMFTDVISASQEWYLDYICYAKDKEWINGYTDGSFKPAANISFVEAAKIITLAFGLGADGSKEPWYRIYVDLLAMQNAIPTTIVRFDQQITRGEMAEMAFRLKSENTSLSSHTYADLK